MKLLSKLYLHKLVFQKILVGIVIIFTGITIKIYAQKSLNKSGNIYLADPTIFFDKGIYYLFGTVEGNSGIGFKGYNSKELLHWKANQINGDGYSLKKGSTYGTKNFWAPQVFKYKDTFYMAYAANENIALAKSMAASGPFLQNIIQPLTATVKQIDPFVFIDDDGKKYLYHVRLENGNKIFVAEMKADFSQILPATLTECITASAGWENTLGVNWPVAEGPAVFKHHTIYYLFYSANDFRNPDYSVGYATSSSPLGPWVKYEGNPILSNKNIGINGCGHGDIIKDKNGKICYVFHTHNSNSLVLPRKTAIVQIKFLKDNLHPLIDKVIVDSTSFHYLLEEQSFKDSI